MEKVLVKNQTNEILSMCKIDNSSAILFTELGRDMFKDNKYILNKYFKNKNGQDCYYANLLAFKQVPNITLYEIKKQLKKDFGKPISLYGYKYNPEHYRFAECYLQEEYEEDLFKCKSNEEEQAELEAERKARIEELDFNAVESLYTVLFKGIKARLVMLLHLDDIPGIINNAVDCFYKGVNCSMSNSAMHSKILEIKNLLENEEVIKWLKTNPTDLMFDKFDYVDTYQRVLRQLTGIRYESLEYCRDLLENQEDLWIEEIIANDYIECESYIENNYTEDEDNYLD